jgi:acetylornithine/N-succinyldiaminopimelate aminotransferase
VLAEGFLVNNTSARTIRMLPPLVVDGEDLDALVVALRRVLGGL